MIRIFVSYSHCDAQWKERLVKHLSVLESEGAYDIWDDKKIDVGTEWLPEIEEALDNAHVAILMLSADFLVSPFIRGKEIPRILDRREKEGLIVIPVFVSPCAWQKIPGLSRIQGYPTDGRTLAEATPPEADKILVALTDEIDKIIKKKEKTTHKKKQESRPAVPVEAITPDPEPSPKKVSESPPSQSFTVKKPGNQPSNGSLLSRVRKRPIVAAVILSAVAVLFWGIYEIIKISDDKPERPKSTVNQPGIDKNQELKSGKTVNNNKSEEKTESPTDNRKPTVKLPETGKNQELESEKKGTATDNKKPIPIPIPTQTKIDNTAEETPDDKPSAVKAMEAKALRVYKNEKGFWEADFGSGIKAVYIPAGEFDMGSKDGDTDEKPVHKVYLDGCWIGKTEVTKKQFEMFTAETGYKTEAEEKKDRSNWKDTGFTQGEDHPVVCVSWNDAVKYCEWLSKKIGLKCGLPTEAQWEKAARGTDGREYPWGSHDPYDKGIWYCNYRANDDWEKRGADGYDYTSPVGKYPQGASPYGLWDMAGNVWEWCADWYGDKYYGSSPYKNPTGPVNGVNRVCRGGSWDYFGGYARSVVRDRFVPSFRWYYIGFRFSPGQKE